MFELLFKYPLTVFAKGNLVLLSGWPAWLLAVAIAVAGALLAWRVARGRVAAGERPRSAIIWTLQTAFLALLLFLLWHPALSVASLKPQENIIAVLVDHSRSMAIEEDGQKRIERAAAVLNGGLLESFEEKFQVRLYRFGAQLERIDKPEQVTAEAGASRIGDALKGVAAEAGTLPIGAVLLVSDGADNSGGIGLDTIAELRRRRIPVHTVGIGRETPARDVEIGDVRLPARALAGSRLGASVTLRNYGYRGQTVRLSVRDDGRVLASREVVLKNADQTETVLFNPGPAGARRLEITAAPLEGEENTGNNSVARLVNVDASKPRILYLEGEPRWEMKFIRRAVEEDGTLQLTSILRTTQNKIYRQGIDDPKELADGFPAKPEDLFGFQGLIVGSVESGYFTPAQQELIREFVDRRGGGVLFLGGRGALAEGGYGRPPFSDLLPVSLPSRGGTFHREPAAVALTPAGRDSIVCRLLEDPERNVARWKDMPVLADYQEVGEPKPGALVLAELQAGRRSLPLLVTQNYGRGRTGVFATGGSWRWQMRQEHTDQTHEIFWRQLLRWLVADTPGQVDASTPQPVLLDEGRVPLRAEVRDKSFRRLPGARVEARILGPEGENHTVTLQPEAGEEGAYTAEWTAEKPGAYLAEIRAVRGGDREEEVGRDVVTFRREDGVAENFRTGQNRELLQSLSEQTGGRYYRPEDAGKLAGEIQYSEAGVTVREMRDLWDMPFIFLLAFGLRSAEWLLRRRWGVV